jgi:hypothetical protein
LAGKKEIIMKTALNFSGVIILCFFLLSCATSKFTQTGENFPPYNGAVKVLQAAPTDKKFVEIGWVSSSGGLVHEWTHLIEAMQEKAAAKGANAIILSLAERPNSSLATYNQQYGFVGGSGTQKSMTAIAIRILE